MIETKIISANGINFEVDIAGKGDKFAMLLHGFPECSYSWRDQIPVLVDMGYTVWAPNMRGYGNSSKPRGVKDYTSKVLIEDIKALFDKSGFSSAVLIGHDWGAAISWNVAIHKAIPLDSLVIMNVPHPKLFLKGLTTWKQLKKSWYILFFQIPFLPEFILTRDKGSFAAKAIRGMAVNKDKFTRAHLSVYTKNISIPGAAKGMLNYYRAIPYEMMRGGQKEMLPDTIIETPTLIIWGEKDKALGKELTYGTDKYVSKLSVHYIPTASHWVQQDEPEKVNSILKEFLTSVEK